MAPSPQEFLLQQVQQCAAWVQEPGMHKPCTQQCIWGARCAMVPLSFREVLSCEAQPCAQVAGETRAVGEDPKESLPLPISQWQQPGPKPMLLQEQPQQQHLPPRESLRAPSAFSPFPHPCSAMVRAIPSPASLCSRH